MLQHNRKSIRLHSYDYSAAGGYFITVCTWNRRCILSSIIPGTKFVMADVRLSELGAFVRDAIEEAETRTGFCVQSYVVMPNHIHMLLTIPEGNKAYRVGDFVGMFKSLTLNRWRPLCDQRGIRMGTVWQRNYYEHVIRNEADFMEKLRYIEENPDAWCMDELYKE